MAAEETTTITVHGDKEVAADFAAVARFFREGLRGVVVAASTEIIDRARANAAAAGSTSIPSTIGGRPLTDGYQIVVDGTNNPISTLWEYGNRSSTSETSFLHPVYGHQDNIVEQPRFRFLAPALKSVHPIRKIEEAVYLEIEKRFGAEI